MTDRHRLPAYTGQEGEWAMTPPPPEAEPRPGHGTVYLSVGHDDSRDRNLVTTATWVDDFDQPNAEGAIAGTASCEGDRDTVIHWTRTRPAANAVVYDFRQDQFIPMPDDDAEVAACLGSARPPRPKRRPAAP